MSISGNVTPKDDAGAPIVRSSAFSDASGFRARFKGISGVAAPGVTNIDTEITEERWINGVRIIVVSANNGDTIGFEVVDKNYLYAGILYPADYNGTPWSQAQPNGVVLDAFGVDWYIDASTNTQPDILVSYPARILQGLFVRAKYNNTGQLNVTVHCNLYLHWKTL